MSDKDDLQSSIDELSKARTEKERKLKAAVQIVAERRRIAREQSYRPT